MLQIDLSNHLATDVIQLNTGVVDGSGNRWWVTELEGWDSPEVRQTMLDKVQDHGQMTGESFFKRRALVVTGLVQCPNDTQYWATQDLLKNALATDISAVGSTNDATLTVYEVPTARYAFVKLSDRIKMKYWAGYWEFSIPLLAIDPRKYLVGAGTPGSTGNPGVF